MVFKSVITALMETEDATRRHREGNLKTRDRGGSDASPLQRKPAAFPSRGHDPADQLTFGLWSVEGWRNRRCCLKPPGMWQVEVTTKEN